MRTFPSHLEDISQTPQSPHLPNTASAARTPEKTSPMRVRTMKEYEEEMAALKKENFNLKLRIYFMQERREQLNSAEDVEALIKSNTELKVQFELLKKDLADKEDLLVQTAKALELLKQGHKANIDELLKSHNAEKEELQNRIDRLDKELKEMKFLDSSARFDDSSAMYALAFGLNPRLTSQTDMHHHIKAVENELEEERRKCLMMKEDISVIENDKRTMQAECSNLQQRVASMQSELNSAQKEIEEKTKGLVSANECLRLLEQTIGKHEKCILLKNETISELENKMNTMERKLSEYEMQKLKEKPSLADLQSKLEAANRENVNLKYELSQVRLLESPSQRGSRTRSTSRHSNERDRDLLKQLKEAHSKQEILEDQLKALSKKCKESEHLIAEKDQRISQKERDYFKACKLLHDVLRTNKQMKKEMIELRGDNTDNSDTASETQSRSGSLHLPTVSDVNVAPVDVDRGHELKAELDELNNKLAAVTMEKATIQLEFECEIQSLHKSLKEKEQQLLELEHKIASVGDMETKDNRISELESEVAELKTKLSELQEKQSSEEMQREQNVVEELEAKKKEIEHLEGELRKRTFNLQELVNKELWDKNREIEKLNKQCERRQFEIMSLKQQINSRDFQLSVIQEKVKEIDMNPLSTSLVMREIQPALIDKEAKENAGPDDGNWLRDQLRQNIEEKRLLTRKVEELKERLRNTPERDAENKIIQNLKSELAAAKQQAEQAEKSRKEVMNACTLLTTRLQELADFLDSLLPLLGAKKRRVVQQAVERSRELSRSFTIAADESQLHTSAWSDLHPSLYKPLLPDISTVDFWSGEDVSESLGEEYNEEHSQVEISTLGLVQKDSELSKTDLENISKVPPPSPLKNSFQSLTIWGLGSLESGDNDNNSVVIGRDSDLINLVSVSDKLPITDMTEGSLLDTCSDRNSPGKSVLVDSNQSDIKKSSNIGRIVVTSKKKDSVKKSSLVWVVGDANGNKNKGESGTCMSESEAWSEPDRDVSHARIGLTEDVNTSPKPLSWAHDDSTDTTTDTTRRSSGGKRISELRRLQHKIRSLEQVNEALRGELMILHQLAPSTLTEPNREDKSTSIELASDVSLPVPAHLLEEIRHQREKLESSLFHNDYIRRQLESAFSSLKSGHGEDIEKPLRLRLVELCSKLEKSELEYKDLESRYKELDNLFVESRMEKEQWRGKVELLQSQISELQANVQEKANEVLEKHCALLEAENTIRQQSLESQKKLDDANNALVCAEQEVERLLARLSELETEKSNLLEKLDQAENENKKLTEIYQTCEKNNRQIQEELNKRLEDCREKKEKFEAALTESQQRLETCEREARAHMAELKTQLAEAERASTEIEAGLRVQLEVATQQCSHFESKLEEMDSVQKLTHLEHLKSELERRVAELEAANTELETKMTNLQIAKPALSDCETEDGASSLPGSPRRTNWVHSEPTSPSKPLSPLVLHQPRYTTQRSHELTSDYLSDQDTGPSSAQTNVNNNPWFPPTSPRSNISASPDLGIESDQGRFSSLEGNPHIKSQAISIREPGTGEIMKLEEENSHLRRHLMKTRCALEETLAQLTAANKKKRQVERAICRQLHKTHSILKKARVNLEAEEDFMPENC